jgi:hypothetical protein
MLPSYASPRIGLLGLHQYQCHCTGCLFPGIHFASAEIALFSSISAISGFDLYVLRNHCASVRQLVR